MSSKFQNLYDLSKLPEARNLPLLYGINASTTKIVLLLNLLFYFILLCKKERNIYMYILTTHSITMSIKMLKRIYEICVLPFLY